MRSAGRSASGLRGSSSSRVLYRRQESGGGRQKKPEGFADC